MVRTGRPRQRRSTAEALDVEMVSIPGGAFQMGSDRHYPEERPAHEVIVDGFLMDATPVTNRQFAAFVAATGYVTHAEIPPDPKDYPGALPHMLRAGRPTRPAYRYVDEPRRLPLHNKESKQP